MSKKRIINNKLYYDGSIFTSDKFYNIHIITDRSNYVEIDDVKHSIILHHKKNDKYSSLPKQYVTVLEDKKIEDADLVLLPTTTILGNYEVITRFTASSLKNELLYSQLISHSINEYEYREYSNGCVIIINDEYKDMKTLVDYVNSKSTMIYLTGLSDFYNILGLNLKYGNDIYPTNLDIYDYQRHVFLNESNVIAAYINHIKSKFPGISVYNIASEHDKDNKSIENLTYKASTLYVKAQHNTNIIMTEPYGRLISSIISLYFTYTTSDIVTYLERKNSYQLQTFVNSLIYFPVNMYDDMNQIVDEFIFSVHYDTGNLEIEPTKNIDDSSKTKYTFTFPAQISCYLLEELQEEYPSTIKNVLANIYIE